MIFKPEPTPIISMTLADRDKLVVDTRRAALEEACKALCDNCRDGAPMIKDKIHFHQAHPSNWMCRAFKVRKLLEN